MGYIQLCTSWLMLLILVTESYQQCPTGSLAPFIFTASYDFGKDRADALSSQLNQHPCVLMAKSIPDFYKLQYSTVNRSAVGLVIMGGALGLTAFFNADQGSENQRLPVRAVVIQREAIFEVLMSGLLPTTWTVKTPVDVIGRELALKVRHMEEAEVKVRHTLKAKLQHHRQNVGHESRRLMLTPIRGNHGPRKQGVAGKKGAGKMQPRSKQRGVHKAGGSSPDSEQTNTAQSHRVLLVRFCDLFCNTTSIAGEKITVTLPTSVLNFVGLSTNATTPQSACNLAAPSEISLASRSPLTHIDQLEAWASLNFSWASRLHSREECGADSPLLNYSQNYGVSTTLISQTSDFHPTEVQEHYSSEHGTTLSTLQLIAKVHEPFLDSKALKRLRSVDKGNKAEISLLGDTIFQQLRRNTIVRRRNEGMDKAETQALIFKRRINPSISSFVLDSSASSRFCDNFGLNTTSLVDRAQEISSESPLVLNLSSHGGNQTTLQESSLTETRSKPLTTAVCLLGATRTFSRDDVIQGFRYRFLAGWGIQNALIFAVLVEEGQTNRSQSDEIISRYQTVASEWYQDTPTTFGGESCSDGHEVKQLKQWSRCLSLIKDYENKTRTKFDIVVKLRPDDLWYGAMMPYCVLDLEKNAYISRQQKRWSDQWFALPRRLAETFLDIVYSNLRPYCYTVRAPHTAPVVVSKIRKENSPPYETMVFDALKTHANRHQVTIVPTLLPRILSRQRGFDPKGSATVVKEANDKCNRFLWFVPKADCLSTMLNDHPVDFLLHRHQD